jgi:5-methylcytosine-specific restriction protein A
MVYETHHWEQAQDRNRDMRQAIVFEVRPIENVEEATGREVAAARTDDLAALRLSAYAAAEPAPATRAATYPFLREAVRFATMLSPDLTTFDA